ncbi:MAG: hypothetical protein KDA21_00535, partial [Phycisphaerales bacterium]|nr:hypothetical protein [Phycisphaerales bacterium]
LERAERARRQEQQPEVLRRASRLLELFTRGWYELLPPRADDKTGAAFVVRDVVTDRIHAVDELSTGTRAQLLLAVRLAFAEQLEGALKLPLFLDEALSSSDPERFEAVVRALSVVAGEGRQVFYLTCRPRDWDRIKDALAKDDTGESGRVPLRLIDLGALRREAAVESSPRWTTVNDVAALSTRDLKLNAVPAYTGQDAAAWAEEAGVPAFDPAAAPSAVHIFHVLEDDPARVATLLSRGVVALGQLKRSPVEHEVLARIALVEAFCEAWQIGRGRPLDREALRRGGISSRFEPEVWSLARAVGLEAGGLLRGLREKRVKGMQTRIVDGLSEALESEGYIDARETLGPEAIRERVRERMARFLASGSMSTATLARRLDRLLAAAGMGIGVG